MKPLLEFTTRLDDGALWIEQTGTIASAVTHFPSFGVELARRANTLPKLEERNAELVEGLRRLLTVSYSGDDVRLLCVGMNGSMMSDPKNKTGQTIHNRCDAMNAAQADARALLAKEAAND